MLKGESYSIIYYRATEQRNTGILLLKRKEGRRERTDKRGETERGGEKGKLFGFIPVQKTGSRDDGKDNYK